MSRELHFGDPGRRWGTDDPRPEARTDEHAARIAAARLAREVHAEQRMSRDHGVVNTRSFLEAGGFRPVAHRDAAGRLIIDWEAVSDGTAE